MYDDKDAKQADVDAAQDALDKAFWATKVEQKPGSQQPGVTDTDKDDKDNKGDRVPPTGAAVSVVAAAAVLLTPQRDHPEASPVRRPRFGSPLGLTRNGVILPSEPPHRGALAFSFYPSLLFSLTQ